MSLFGKVYDRLHVQEPGWVSRSVLHDRQGAILDVIKHLAIRSSHLTSCFGVNPINFLNRRASPSTSEFAVALAAEGNA